MESSIQSIPGDDSDAWLPVYLTDRETYSPSEYRYRYERHDDVIHEIVDGPIEYDYQELRRRAYPGVADQLDAIWKGGADMEAMRAAVLAVKEQHLEPTSDPLDQAKEIRLRIMRQRRDAEEFGTFVWDGSTFDASPESVSRFIGAVMMSQWAQAAGQPFSVSWTLADNSERTMSASDMAAAAQALGAHTFQVHADYKTVKNAIQAATTIEEVQAITWPEI